LSGVNSAFGEIGSAVESFAGEAEEGIEESGGVIEELGGFL
jgi:hypothetical protein